MSINGHLASMFSAGEPDVNENHFSNIALDYPYCSIAQFYYLLQAKRNNSPEFIRQSGKTALYFNNIDWLKWQLHLNTLIADTEDKIERNTFSENFITIPKDTEVIETENLTVGIEKPESTKAPRINTTAEELVAFEPLHTVDYFASQGIKITDEPLANDKLGSQMKSFTEWLKSMRSVHAQKLPGENEEDDSKIQHIAENSNVQSDVLTEAMAQVLVKQKKLEKAIAMYEKLSLINPSKSAYFAGKIKSLKSL